MNNTIKNSMCVVATALFSVATTSAGTVNTPVQATFKSLLDISGVVSADIVSGQVYRGVVLDRNPVVQPRLSVSVPLGIDNVTLKACTTETFGAKSPLNGFVRTENEIGVEVKVGDFTVTPSFQTLYSPNSRYESSEGVGVGVQYDDSKFLGAFALKPRVNAYFTTNGQNGNNQGGQYYEIGIEPSYRSGKNTFSLPVNMGIGNNNYYANDKSYGYTSVGAVATRALTDRISLKAGVTYFSTAATVNDKSSTWSTTGGISYSF
jgi:hypothetical protein